MLRKTLLAVALSLVLLAGLIGLFSLFVSRTFPGQTTMPTAGSATTPPVPPVATIPTNDQMISAILQSEQNLISLTFGVITTLLAVMAIAATVAVVYIQRSAESTERRFGQIEDTARQAVELSEEAKKIIEEARTENKRVREEIQQAIEMARRTEKDVQFSLEQARHLNIGQSIGRIIDRNNRLELRIRELQLLAQMFDPASLPVFEFILRYEKDPALITNAAYGVQKLGLLSRNSRILELLTLHCGSDNVTIRESCIECLGEVALPEDEELLRKLQGIAETDSSKKVRDAAKNAFGMIMNRELGGA